MRQTYRSMLWAGFVAVGVAACGDDVTVTPPAPPPPPPAATVHSVSVAPDGVTIPVAGTVQMVASVNADAGVATTVTWNTASVAATGKATLSATGLLTAVAPGAVAVQACSVPFPTICGGATINISSTAATVTSVTVTPSNAGYVVGQTPVTYSASVQGTNSPAQTVTWSTASGTNAVVSVGAATGVVTVIAAGTEVIKACSTIVGFTNVCGSSSVTVVNPAPTQISLQAITQGGTQFPVTLSNVGGQVDVVLNVDPGAGSVSKVQVLIGGAIAAEQTFTGPSAPAVAGNGTEANAVQLITLSLNTAQVKKLANNLFVPVFFNGPNLFSAKLFVTGNATGIPSTNVIPVVLQNQDALLSAPAFTLAPASPLQTAPGTVSSGGAAWFKGNVTFTGGNFVSFFPVTPSSSSWTSVGTVTCSASANSTSGTPQTGITFSGTWSCGSSVQNSINLGVLTLTPGTAPAADVIDLAYAGYSQTGSAYQVAGENRYNLLGGGSAPAPTGVFIDNKAPIITPNEIGFRAGCSATIPVPGCWINGSYSLTGDFPATDAGSGLNAVNTFSYDPSIIPNVCTSSSLTPASALEDASPTKYNACATASDVLGNTSTAFGFNAFGVDKTSPTITYATDGVAPALYTPNSTLAEAVPAQALDWKVNDNNAGLDTATALTVATAGTTLNGSCGIAINGALNAQPSPGADRFLIPANAPAPDAGCGKPGYYHYQATVRDRAGNSASDVDRIFGFEPGVPTINALAPTPLYGGGTTTTVNVFASHTGASLSAAKVGIWYTSQAAGPVNTPVQFVFNLGQMFNAPFQTPLFLATPSLGTAFSVSAGNSLAGIVIDSTLAPISAFDSLTAIVRDVFDASNLTGALVHADTANMVNPPAFIDATKVSTSGSVWSNPNMGAATFSGAGACTFSYATPTNGPTIPTAVWVVSFTVANQYNVLFTSVNAPTLISDNGTTRIYRYSVSGSTCASLGGTLKLVAIKNDGAGLPVGYVVQ